MEKTLNNQFVCFIFFVVKGIFRNVFKLTDDEFSKLDKYINNKINNKNENKNKNNNEKLIDKIRKNFIFYIKYVEKQNNKNDNALNILKKIKENVESENNIIFLIYALLLLFNSNSDIRNTLIHNVKNGETIFPKNKNIEEILSNIFSKKDCEYEKLLFYYYSLFIPSEIINDYLNCLNKMKLDKKKPYTYVNKFCLEKNLFSLNIRPFVFDTNINNLKEWDIKKYHYCKILLNRLSDDFKDYKEAINKINEYKNQNEELSSLKKDVKFFKNQIYTTIMFIFKIHINKYNNDNKNEIKLEISANKKYIYGIVQTSTKEIKKFQITFSNIGYYYSKNNKDIFKYDDFKNFIMNEFNKNKNSCSINNKSNQKLTFEERYWGIEGRRKKIHNDFIWLLKFITKLIDKNKFKNNKIIQFVYGYNQLYKDNENNNDEKIKDLKEIVNKIKNEINENNSNKKMSISDEIESVYEKINSNKKEILCEIGKTYLNNKDILNPTNKNKNPQPNFLFLFTKSDYKKMLISVSSKNVFSDQVETFLNYELERFIHKICVKDVIYNDKLNNCLKIFKNKNEKDKKIEFWKLFYKEFLNDWKDKIILKDNKTKKR